MRFMIDHYDHLIAWGEWALTTIEAWDDTTMEADTWRGAAEDIFRDAAAFISWGLPPDLIGVLRAHSDQHCNPHCNSCGSIYRPNCR
jgi:hypothetical protein